MPDPPGRAGAAPGARWSRVRPGTARGRRCRCRRRWARRRPLREPIGLLLPAAHELAGGDDGGVAVECLADHPIVLSEPGCAYRDHILAAFRDRGISLDVRAEIGSSAATVEAVQAGLGIALLPIAGLVSPPRGTVTRRVRGVDLSLAVGLVRANAGEPYSVLTSHLTAAIRSAAPGWARAL